jgi:hypothetical protein
LNAHSDAEGSGVDLMPKSIFDRTHLVGGCLVVSGRSGDRQN